MLVDEYQDIDEQQYQLNFLLFLYEYLSANCVTFGRGVLLSTVHSVKGERVSPCFDL